MKWLNRNAVLFSVKTCLAAFVAFYIALELNLEKPAWSLTTVYVASQLYSASTISKSIYRLMGTVLGGAFIWLIYPTTVVNPLLFSLAVSLWVAGCLWLSLHDRTPKSYVFMLAGYSAAIMGFPDVTTPLAISYTVISRVEEITVGIACSSFVHMLIFPVRMRSLLEYSVSNWYQSACNLCREMLKSEGGEGAPEREQILVQMANYPLNVEALITHCVYEGESARRLIRLVSAQYQHLSYLIPTLTAIEKRLSLLAEQQIAFPPAISDATQQFLLWLNDGAASEAVPGLQQTLASARDGIEQQYHRGEMSIEESLLFSGLLERLENVVRIAQAYQGVSERVSELKRGGKRVKPPKGGRHVDKGMLLLSSFTAFVATMLACLFWIGTGWKDGSTAPMIAAVVCSFFAALDSPVGSMQVFLKGVLIAIVISILYIVLLVPQAITFEALIICLAPGLLALGLVIANPATNFIGLIIATQLPSFIGLSHDFRPDLLAVVNAAFSTMVGIIIALVVTALIRNKRPSWTAKRALRRGVKELVQFISDIRLGTATLRQRQQFVVRMLDRINIILPRNKVDPLGDVALGGNLITEIWLGVNFYDFYARYQPQLTAAGIDAEPLAAAIHRYLKQRLKDRSLQPDDRLLATLNQTLLLVELRCHAERALFMPLYYLFNIRMALYPRERWPQPAPAQLALSD